MNQKKLLVERIDNHIILTLNRAEKRNALDDELVSDLEDFFSQPVEDCQCIIIQGSGEHFSAGLDLFELMEKRSSDPIVSMRRSKQWHRVFDLIQYGEVPVISVLKGGVIGGGFELAAATHIRVSEASTYFQLPEGQRGIFVGGGGSVRIPRIIGAGRVMELMLTGRKIPVEESANLGLSHYVVENGQGLDKALALAGIVSQNAPTSNYAIIHGISRIGEMSSADGLFAETMVTSMTRNAGKSDKRIKDFFQQRKAQTN
ncbi:crotonase/enoyl-CoA hydratase family protein [Advenella sp. RU8]|uniref:crotonase/enoyl-CoA hydratase family protein n=1 Tax=Advenella sp. RU8 TaxID=3399575 RepID=UPI003AAB89C6